MTKCAHDTDIAPSAEPVVKRREIRFAALHSDPDQAETARQLLADSRTVLSVERRGEGCLCISYDLRQVTLCDIEDALQELGFHLDNSLLCRLKRALYHFTEGNERAALGATSVRAQWAEPNDPRDVFVRHYLQHRHGCRDERPKIWREYL